MYEYNFDEKRNNIEEILKISIEESREKYYFELESFNNEEKQSHDKGIKKKKTIKRTSAIYSLQAVFHY